MVLLTLVGEAILVQLVREVKSDSGYFPRNPT